jgi:hypothetical protein
MFAQPPIAQRTMLPALKSFQYTYVESLARPVAYPGPRVVGVAHPVFGHW